MVTGLRRYLARANLNLADVFQSEVLVPEIEARIRSAYRRLAKEANGWVSLTELRPLLGDAPREAVDEVLRRLERMPQVHVIPEENRKVITGEDRVAAIRIGGEDKHLLAIEEP
jgi:hypothetical protein